jgi:hypothetical protein
MGRKRSSCYLKAEFKFRPTRKRLSVSLHQDASRIAAHRRNRSEQTPNCELTFALSIKNLAAFLNFFKGFAWILERA